MPLFSKARRRDGEGTGNDLLPTDSPQPPRWELPPKKPTAPPMPTTPPPPPPRPDTPPQPKLVFHCQLAHGSPTGIISGFGNVKELYQRIAECYDMPSSEVSSRPRHVLQASAQGWGRKCAPARRAFG